MVVTGQGDVVAAGQRRGGVRQDLLTGHNQAGLGDQQTQEGGVNVIALRINAARSFAVSIAPIPLTCDPAERDAESGVVKRAGY